MLNVKKEAYFAILEGDYFKMSVMLLRGGSSGKGFVFNKCDAD